MRHRSTARVCGRRLAAALLVAFATVLFGCEGEETPAPETMPAPTAGEATPPAATEAEETAPPEDEGAEVTDGIPENFPSDVPVYPGAVAGPAMSMPGLGVFATFESEDDVTAVLDHYRSGLTSNGWTVEEVPELGGLDAEKDARSLQVRARETESGVTEIAVNVSEG